MPPDSTREKLAREIDTVSWQDLRSHAVADRMFIVSGDVEVLDVAVAVADDMTEKVETWTQSGQLSRPTLEQMQVWERSADIAFHCVIVAPFVLTAELPRAEAVDEPEAR